MNRNRRNRKKSGTCPVCESDMKITKKELFEKLDLDGEKIAKEGLTEKDIKEAYREAAKTHHPDKGGDPDVFQELSEAKEELMDMVKEELDPLDINPIGDALERQRVEDIDPLEAEGDTGGKQERLSIDQLKEVLKSINNLKKARMKNPSGPCPYCKKRPRH